MLNDKQHRTFKNITWLPETGPTGWGFDIIANIHGVRVVLYPSGKIDILTIADSQLAREYETALRKNYGHLILEHVHTYRAEEVRINV